ncbi:transcriptional regulator [Alloalcanivorax dieselolei]|uniref:winged helix-turn-helix transcriptional regulator n=1 Tax=Alloalcanivorax TaxID=3020832 RepID=UPI0004794692|nr:MULTISPECIES: helix-turn-helix domain-containing protein [Alloalcanivorax]MBA4721520.1 helix-turn-helix transcriptional regulator [Alcanivorax sp.]PHS60567.1 MAG: transcriptional regulator [Alcanivorax sp.]GGK04178.1 transcriptional regulator [Alloalcanivorax dieselolei]CUR45232.1 Transcriptional regulator, HxlR family [Alloalcanivorax xenomutans]
MPRRPSSDSTCPVARAVDVIGDRWCLLILRDAFDGVCRFRDFQRDLGMARNILTDRLRRLVDAGVLDTRPASDGTAYQEYVLTAKGESLFPVVVALRQWGEHHLFARGERHSLLIDKNTGKPVPFMTPRDEDGHMLPPDQSEVRKLT